MAADEFDFDGLEETRIPVKYGGHLYLLCEATGGTAAKYQNTMLSAARMERGADKSVKVSGMGGLADAEFVLLAGCLWHTNPDGSKKSTVAESVIRGWPHRVTEPLYKKAKEISLIDVEGTDGPKGSPTGTASGSSSPDDSGSPSASALPE